MERIRGNQTLPEQMHRHATKQVEPVEEGDFGRVVSTGSTLLDLAISGGRIRGGGIPAGILVEIYGPSGSGKTVLLSEIAGNVMRLGGKVMYHDPEARFDPQFAKLFGMSLSEVTYGNPDTVPEVFRAVREWQPEGREDSIHGIFADSLAALSTDLEMEAKEGDKMGTRRAKEFSEELRKTCRILKRNGYLMVCSNQVRENIDAGPYGLRDKPPGGKAMEFYSSLRLRTLKPEKIKVEQQIAGRKVTRVVGVDVQLEVTKSSIWKPYRTAPLTILFDYGIDDIRQNLQFIKDHTKYTTYTLGGESVGRSMTEAIDIVEKNGYERDLRNEVIDLWEEIESKFESKRKPRIHE